MSRLICCLQFHENDKPQAMRLAKLIADIEPISRDDVEFVFVARFDCAHDHATIGYVATKFPVNWFTTHTKWTGWPGGPNAMALDTLQWLAANRQDVLGALLIEPDCVPTSRDWIDKLIREWSMARLSDKIVMGAWRPSGGVDGHINGCCVVQPNIASQIGLGMIGPDLAWDAAIAPFVKDRWLKTGLIKNCFQSLGATEDALKTPDEGTEQPAFVHGYKDSSAMDIATRCLL